MTPTHAATAPVESSPAVEPTPVPRPRRRRQACLRSLTQLASSAWARGERTTTVRAFRKMCPDARRLTANEASRLGVRRKDGYVSVECAAQLLPNSDAPQGQLMALFDRRRRLEGMEALFAYAKGSDSITCYVGVTMSLRLALGGGVCHDRRCRFFTAGSTIDVALEIDLLDTRQASFLRLTRVLR